MKVLTNQFSMTLGSEINVYYYHINVFPEIKMHDTYILYGLLRDCKKKLDQTLGLYIYSGSNIFTTTNLEDEDLVITHKYKGTDYTIEVPLSSKRFIAGKGKHKIRMEDHKIFHTLLNIIIKDAFRNTDLKQIGKAPRYFDTNKPLQIE